MADEIRVGEVTSGVTPQNDTLYIERTYIDACKAKALEDYEGAIVLFKEILKVDPENAPALFELSRIYFGYGRIDDAKELANAAINSDGENEYYQLLLADILTYGQQFPEAVKILEQLKKNYPQKIDNYYQLSYVFERIGDIKKSISVLQDAQKQFGDDEGVLVELQRLYVKAGDVNNALSNLQKLILQNPDNPSYYNMIGDVYEIAKNSSQAEETYAILLTLDPDNPDLLLSKAEMEKAKGNFTGYYQTMKDMFAIPSINIDKKIFFLVPFVDSITEKNFVQKDFIFNLTQILTETHPADAKSFAMRGDFLYYAQQLQEARKNYRQSLTIREDVYDVWLKIFYIDADLKQNDSLQTVTEQSMEIFPNQPMGYYFNGLSYINRNMYEDAIQVLKRALPIASSNTQLKADIYLRLGDSYNELKKYAESDAAYESSLQLNPKNPYTLNNYAYHLSLRKEKLDRAAEMAKLANELVPNNSSLLDTYAWVLYQQEKYKEAKQWIEKALKNGGDKSEVILEHYGDVLYQLGDVNSALENWKKAKQLGTGSELLDRKIDEGKLYE
ncbi:MAG: tetratricopeptide repeat protein [Chitinophagales bacterium]